MSAKLVLDMAAMQEDFFADTALIGIASSLPAYRFCWMLNQRLGINFIRQPEQDIILQSGKKEQFYFPYYEYNMPMHGSKFSIYKLKSGNEALLPEVKQLDYLWMLEGPSSASDADAMAKYTREMPDIQLAQILSSDRLKHISHLLV